METPRVRAISSGSAVNRQHTQGGSSGGAVNRQRVQVRFSGVFDAKSVFCVDSDGGFFLHLGGQAQTKAVCL